MPKIHPHKDHKRYTQIKKDAKALGDNNMCTVVAAAVLTGLDYKTCFDAFEKAGRKKGRGANVIVQKEAFKLLGFKCVDYKLSEVKKRYKGPHKKLKHFTTYHPIRFAYAWRDVPDVYLQGPTHAAAYKDGLVVDWSNDRKTRVTEAYRIVPIEKPVRFTFKPQELTIGKQAKFSEISYGRIHGL